MYVIEKCKLLSLYLSFRFHIQTDMIYIFLFIFGLLFGSFGSVILSRLGKFSLHDIWSWSDDFQETLKSVIRWRSQCPHCKHTLHSIDLIPVISYLSTKWKCRYCKTPISYTYPLLEIGCGIVITYLWYIILLIHIWWFHTILWFVMWWLLYLLIIFDLQTHYLHEIVRAWAVLTSIGLLATSSSDSRYYGIEWAIIFTIFFLCIYYIWKLYVRWRWKKDGEWFWIGDVRLAPIIWVQLGLAQTRYTNIPLGIDGVIHFQWYLILSGVLSLLCAGLIKIITPQEPIREIPFFPGMIVALWIVLAMIWFQIN